MSRFLFFWEFYKKDSEDYFKNFPSINVFSFVGDNESLLANGDLLWIIWLHFIDSRRYSLEWKYFFSLKEDLSNTSTLVINRWDDWENGFKLHMLKESFFSYLWILIYLELLDNNIQWSISCIFSATLIQEEKINEQKKLIWLIHIFNRIRSSVERMRFEKIWLLTIKKCECCDNDFSKEYEEKIKKFIKQQSKLYNQSLSSIEWLVTLENTYENKKLQNKIFWLTIGMAFMVFIQVMLIEYNNKVLFKYIFN